MKKFYKIIAVFVVTLMFLGLNINAQEDGKSFAEDKLIIKFKSSTSYNDEVKKKIEDSLSVEIKKVKKIDISAVKNYYVVYTKNKIVDIEKKVEEIKKMDVIEETQLSYKYTIDPNIPNPKGTRAVVEDYWHIKASGADRMKSAMNKKARIKVGIVDTGIDYNHKYIKGVYDKNLSKNFIDGESSENTMDKDGHGTHVAGTVSSTGKSGVGDNIDLVSLRVFDNGTYPEEMAAAIDYAGKNNIKVLNMSIGFEDDFSMDEILYEAIKAYDGVIMMPPGNDDKEIAEYPAGYDLDNIISVGAINSEMNKSPVSNYGKDVDIFAPGQMILSSCSEFFKKCTKSYPSDLDMSHKTGTSMSAPVIAGIAGSLLVDNPDLTTKQIVKSIFDGVVEYEPLKDLAVTNGYIDGYKALMAARGDKPVDPPVDPVDETKSYFEVQKDGSVQLWGNNLNGQLGNGTKVSISASKKHTIKLDNEEIVAATTSLKNVFLVTKKGNLYVSGKNDYNQLGQTNSLDSTKFVKFNLKSSSHKVKNVQLISKVGAFSEDSLKINLVSISGIAQYYKLGNDSFELGTTNYVKTKAVQHVTEKSNKKVSIVFYKENSNLIVANEINTYNSNGLSKQVVKNNYSDHYTLKTSFDYDKKCGVNKAMLFKKLTNKNETLEYNGENYKVTCQSNGKSLKKYKTRSFEITYKNNKKVKRLDYKYNSIGELKTNKNGIALVQIIEYDNKGRIKAIGLKYYDSKGNLTNFRLTEKKLYGKYYYNQYKYKYNSKGIITLRERHSIFYNRKYHDYLKIEYKKKKKNAAFGRKFKKGVKVKDTFYKYNSKGQLKTIGKSKAYAKIKIYKKNKLALAYSYEFNKKGKKINRKQTYPKVRK